MNARLGIALLLLLIPSGVAAQIEAQQGQDAPRWTETRFTSPMILTLSLEGLGTLPFKEAKRYPEIRANVCDDAYFSLFEVSRRKGPHVDRKPTTILQVHAFLSVRPSFDRDVDLRLEVVHSERVLAKVWLLHLDAEEGKSLEIEQRLSLDAEAGELLVSREPPQLRVTMYVRERQGMF